MKLTLKEQCDILEKIACFLWAGQNIWSNEELVYESTVKISWDDEATLSGKWDNSLSQDNKLIIDNSLSG